MLLAGALAAGGVSARLRLRTALRGFARETFVDVARGTGTAAIADDLRAPASSATAWQTFGWRASSTVGAGLQAGEYRFDKAAAPSRCTTASPAATSSTIELTVPEGKNIFDIGAALEQSGHHVRGADFLTAARDPSLDPRSGPPTPPRSKATCSPAPTGSTATPRPSALQQMTDTFREAGAEPRRRRRCPPNRDAGVVGGERKESWPRTGPRSRSVFEKRLRIGMKLDCDPTTIYAALLEDRYRGVIHRTWRAAPYNTYQHRGLPPGPIANPGLASIDAALAPSDSDSLYFVARADGSGGHC